MNMERERADIERVRLFRVPSASDEVLDVWQVTDEDGRPNLYFRENDALLPAP